MLYTRYISNGTVSVSLSTLSPANNVIASVYGNNSESYNITFNVVNP